MGGASKKKMSRRSISSFADEQYVEAQHQGYVRARVASFNAKARMTTHDYSKHDEHTGRITARKSGYRKIVTGGGSDELLHSLDQLLRRKQGGSSVHMDYYRHRFYGPEISFLRTIILNLQTLELAFPDGNGEVWVRPVQTFISINQYQNKGRRGQVSLDMRLSLKDPKQIFTDLNQRVTKSKWKEGTGSPDFSRSVDPTDDRRFDEDEEKTRLKEQVWEFKDPHDAAIFARLVDLMDSRGIELFHVFMAIDRGNKDYLEVADVEAAVKEISDESIKKEFTSLAIARMFSEVTLSNMLGRLNFSDFFAFMAFTPSENPTTLTRYLVKWKTIAQQRHEFKLRGIEQEQVAGPSRGGRISDFFSPVPIAGVPKNTSALKSRPQAKAEFSSSEDEEPRWRPVKDVKSALTKYEGNAEKSKSLVRGKASNQALAIALKHLENDSSPDAEKSHMTTNDIIEYLTQVSNKIESDPDHAKRIVSGEYKNILVLHSPRADTEVELAKEIEILKEGSFSQLKALKKADQADQADQEDQEDRERSEWTGVKSAKQVAPVEDPFAPRLLQGEIIMNTAWNSVFALCTEQQLQQLPHQAARKGNIYLTNFRLSFVSFERETCGESGEPVLTNRIHVPLRSIARVDKLEGGDSLGFQTCISCKDHKSIYYRFSRDKDPAAANMFSEVVKSYAFSDDPKILFAFAAHRHPNENHDHQLHLAHHHDDGWNAFEPEHEYRRLGLLSSDQVDPEEESAINDSVTGAREKKTWRLVDNSAFDICETYPSAFIVPAELSHEEVKEAAEYRSKKRLPVVTWRSPCGPVLARSSQPMSGITATRSLADKLLLNLLRTRGQARSKDEEENDFHIIDCRSKLAANANAALGKGVESDKNFVRTHIFFCGIGNIHAMRDSYASLGKLINPGIPQRDNLTEMGSKVLGAIRKGLNWAGLYNDQYKGDVDSRNTSEFTDKFSSSGSTGCDDIEESMQLHTYNMEFDRRLADTGWLGHVSTVMSSSIIVAQKLYKEQSGVLVHCSDGWDRTAQVCSTAQLILDPHYRTLRGLFTLIEKDWTGFGHKFHDRLGVGYESNKGGKEGDEISPIFIQWLDVVWQMIDQFPTAFEYNETLLIFIADSLHSCISGTFLGNSEMERKTKLNCHTSTYSLWSYVLAEKEIFVNREWVEVEYPIWPEPRIIRMWNRYHFRYSPSAHPRVHTSQLWYSYHYGAAEKDHNEYHEENLVSSYAGACHSQHGTRPQMNP